MCVREKEHYRIGEIVTKKVESIVWYGSTIFEKAVAVLKYPDGTEEEIKPCFGLEFPKNGSADYVEIYRWSYAIRQSIGIRAPKKHVMVIDIIEYIPTDPQYPYHKDIVIKYCEPSVEGTRPKANKIGYEIWLGGCWPPGRKCVGIVTSIEYSEFGTPYIENEESVRRLKAIRLYPSFGSGKLIARFGVSYPELLHLKDEPGTMEKYPFNWKVENGVLIVVPIY